MYLADRCGLRLEPDFDRLVFGVLGKLCHDRRSEVFLNASWTSSSACGWRGRTCFVLAVLASPFKSKSRLEARFFAQQARIGFSVHTSSNCFFFHEVFDRIR
jgi:hypothetical protein